jgi:hypothetical protein
MKLKDFEIQPGEACPICKKPFADGEPAFRGSDADTGEPVTIHALCAFNAVKNGAAHFDGVLGRTPVGRA